jgi:catechol 2,3-dioxygenase-like lactoylglutathione lyase family enzyme
MTHATELDLAHPARRFLHICYCCDDVEGPTAMFVEGLGLKNTMRTTDEYNPGDIFSMDRMIRSQASFVYDQRGPRTSPAVEVQCWTDPKPLGEASTDPFEVGIKAIGFAVTDIDATTTRLVRLGCAVIARGRSPFEANTVMLRDPKGITLELVEDQHLGDRPSQMHHLRVTATNLDASISFYESLGFGVLERDAIEGGSWVGADATATGLFARMRLPDEPTELHLVEWTSPSSHGRHYAEPFHAGIYRAALAVDDTRASYKIMSEAGAVFEREPLPVELKGTPVPDMWITFIQDPDGAAYEFVQRPRSAFR